VEQLVVPLTEKGEKIKGSMERQYGKEKGEQVFYASKNKGKISGVDDAHLNTHPGKDIKPDDNQHMGFSKGEAAPVEKLVQACDSLIARMDAFESRRAMKRPSDVKPRTKDNMQPSDPHPKEVKVPGGG
jgi:hypothetical protein